MNQRIRAMLADEILIRRQTTRQRGELDAEAEWYFFFSSPTQASEKAISTIQCFRYRSRLASERTTWWILIGIQWSPGIKTFSWWDSSYRGRFADISRESLNSLLEALMIIFGGNMFTYRNGMPRPLRTKQSSHLAWFLSSFNSPTTKSSAFR